MTSPYPARREKPSARRDLILDTAVRQFAQNGFDRVSTRQIAREAGATEGLIFHYFGSKGGLLSAILESDRSYAGELLRALEEHADGPLAELLPTLAHAWLDALRREQEITLVLIGSFLYQPDVARKLSAMISQGERALATQLRLRKAAGEVRPDFDVYVGAHDFLSPIFMFFMSCRDLDEAAWRRTADNYVPAHVDNWLRGAAKV